MTVQDKFSVTDEMFFIDTKGSTPPPADSTSPLACVWEDEDDAKVTANISSRGLVRKLRQEEDETRIAGAEYTARLQKMRSGILKAPKWAVAAKESHLGEDDDFGFESYPVGELDKVLMSNSGSKNNSSLLPDTLNLSKTQSIRLPSATPNCLESVHFHPSNPDVLLTSGLDKQLHFFKLDGSNHERLYSAQLSDLPITASAFVGSDGSEAMAVGKRSFFYSFDLQRQAVTRISGVKGRTEKQWNAICSSGKFVFLAGAEGCIVVLSGRSKQCVATLKMNEPVEALECTADGKYLLSVGVGSVVYIWDLSTLKCVKRFTDNGGVKGTALGVSGDNSLLSVGSYSGIVNVYDLQNLLSTTTSASAVEPIKTYENLLTPISGTRFHPSSQLLSIYSREKRNALRMIHYPTGRVYTNWPTERSPLGRVVDVDFNCTGSTVAFGGKDGVVQIYNLKHFSN